MLSGLLITLEILVCIALVGVVLLQRSEGGAFGMGGGPTGLITARGAGDLLTRTTWVLFTIFLALSVGLTLLGAHDRSSSSVLERLKLQQANPNALNQPVAPAAPTPLAPPVGQPAGQPAGALLAPPPQAAPQAAPTAPTPTAPAAARATHQHRAAEAQPAAPALEAPAPKPAAPTLEAPAPQPAPQPAPAQP